MKNELSDEELQRLLEEADPSFKPPVTSQSIDEDLVAYQHLFTALKHSPPNSLPPTFSTSAVERIQVQQRRAANRRFYVLLSILFLTGLALSFTWGGLINYRNSQLIVQTLDQAKSWLFFGLGCLLIVQLLDHRLIKKRMGLLH